MPYTSQDALDYAVNAQARVAYSTRALTKSTTFALTTPVLLPDDVARVIAAQAGGADLPLVPERDALMALSGATGSFEGHWLMGRTFGVLPQPATPLSVTIYYQARPVAPADSDGSLELTGDHARLVDRLVAHYQLADDGQPERSQAELAFYQDEARRVRARRIYPRRRKIAIRGWTA